MLASIEVERATPSHAPWIRALDGLSASTARMLELDLGAPDRCCLVAVDRSSDGPTPVGAGVPSPVGVVVGYVAAIVQLGELHMLDVVVAGAYRRRGIATTMLDALDVEALARGAVDATLEVAADNLAAQALYRRRGFEPEGRRRSYYRDGQDALIMWRRHGADVEGE